VDQPLPQDVIFATSQSPVFPPPIANLSFSIFLKEFPNLAGQLFSTSRPEEADSLSVILKKGDQMTRQRIFARCVPWEPIVGYSRGGRIGNAIAPCLNPGDRTGCQVFGADDLRAQRWSNDQDIEGGRSSSRRYPSRRCAARIYLTTSPNVKGWPCSTEIFSERSGHAEHGGREQSDCAWNACGD